MKFSNYWKDNQKEQFASDYPIIKKIEQDHLKEVQELKEYYKKTISDQDAMIYKLNKEMEKITDELSDKDMEIATLLTRCTVLELKLKKAGLLHE